MSICSMMFVTSSGRLITVVLAGISSSGLTTAVVSSICVMAAAVALRWMSELGVVQ